MVALARPGGMGGALRRPTGMAGEGCVATGPAIGLGRSCGLGKRKERSGAQCCEGKKRRGRCPGCVGKEMGQRNRFVPRSVWRFEKPFYISRF
jgi:hypothetical protein